jgi:hypothetical protein
MVVIGELAAGRTRFDLVDASWVLVVGNLEKIQHQRVEERLA